MNIVSNNPIAVFIKKSRKEKKITQRSLAESAGVGLRFIRELERGKTTLRLDKVNDVLALFGKQVGPVSKNNIENSITSSENLDNT